MLDPLGGSNDPHNTIVWPSMGLHLGRGHQKGVNKYEIKLFLCILELISYLPGAAWGCPGLPGAAWGCLVLPGAAWGCLGVPGPAWGCLALPGAAWGYLGLPGKPGAAWGCLGLPGAA